MKIVIVFLFGFINGITILQVVAATSARSGVSAITTVQETQAVQQNVAVLQQANVTMNAKLANTAQSLQQVIAELNKIKAHVKIEGNKLTLFSLGKIAIKGSHVSIDGNHVNANGNRVVTCVGGKPTYHQSMGGPSTATKPKLVVHVKCN